MADDATDLRLVEIKAALEREVRASIESELLDNDERAQARDRAMRALVISSIAAALIILPLAGAVIGLAVRAYRMAAGL